MTTVSLKMFVGPRGIIMVELWTSFAVMPAEIVFDAIEAELECREVEL